VRRPVVRATGTTGSAAAADMADSGELGAVVGRACPTRQRGSGLLIGDVHAARDRWTDSGTSRCERPVERRADQRSIARAYGTARGTRRLGAWHVGKAQGGLGKVRVGRHGAAQRRPARKCFTATLFERENLQKLE
jgi:hypothetical protein